MGNFHPMDIYRKKLSSVKLHEIVENKLVELYDDDYQYDCWREGDKVGIRKSGKWFHNAGMKRIYFYDCNIQKMQVTDFKSLHQLTLTFSQ